MTIKVDLNMLLSNKLKVEEYFVLFCLINHLDETLVRYVNTCGSIPPSVFQKLKDSGYIALRDESNITFDTIIIKEESKKLFNLDSNEEVFEKMFSELLSIYPSKVKRLTGGTRRLHNDLDKCKKIYKVTLLSRGALNTELHQKILLCVKMYHQEHLKDNKLEFMQLLSTFLNQKTWQQFLEDISNLKDLPKPTTSSDAI